MQESFQKKPVHLMQVHMPYSLHSVSMFCMFPAHRRSAVVDLGMVCLILFQWVTTVVDHGKQSLFFRGLTHLPVFRSTQAQVLTVPSTKAIWKSGKWQRSDNHVSPIGEVPRVAQSWSWRTKRRRKRGNLQIHLRVSRRSGVITPIKRQIDQKHSKGK